MARFSYSQALLAIAIAMLAFSLYRVSEKIPEIAASIDKTTVSINQVTQHIPAMIKTVHSVNEQIPPVLTEVALTRQSVANVVSESRQYSQQLPALFEQLSHLEQQLSELQRQLPGVLQRIDSVVITTQNTTGEIAKWRPYTEQFLAQLEFSRHEIPVYLSRVENIVAEAKTVGEEASSGLVSGLFKGVVSLPFQVLGGLGNIVTPGSRSANNLTPQDIEIMGQHADALLNEPDQDKTIWQNDQSGNRGTIEKGRKLEQDNQVCHRLVITNYFKQQQETLRQLMCRDPKGLWQIK